MRKVLTTGLAVIAVGVGSLTAVTPASASESLAVAVDIAQPDSFKDTSGRPLDVSDDTGTAKNVRIVKGQLENGDPFVEQIYYGMVDDIEVGDLTPPSYQDKSPGALVPQMIIAVTPSTISTSWLGEGSSTVFELFVDETSQGQQPSSNFVVEDLDPGAAYSLRLTSTTPSGEEEVRTLDPDKFQARLDEQVAAILAGNEPTDEPTDQPTDEPTDQPTDEPTDQPTDQPTDEPTDEPTDQPTDEPTDEPTDQPTDEPTDEPTDQPTGEASTGVRPAHTVSSTVSIVTPTSSSARMRSVVPGGDAAPTTVSSTDFRYRTFIPWYSISEGGDSTDQVIQKSCLAVASAFFQIPGAVSDTTTMTFLGDNRGFKAPSDSDDRPFRTETAIHVDWSEGKSSTDEKPGYTRVFNESSYEVVAEKQAGMDGIKFSKWADFDAGYIRYNILHVANDPFCPHASVFGSITYNVNVDFYDTGLVKIDGWQYTMPSHETWVRWNDSQTWNKLFTSDATHLYCLIWGGLVGPASGDPSEHPTVCSQTVSAKVTRSMDRWVSFDSDGTDTALTKSGRIWLSGDYRYVRPFGGFYGCYVNDLVSAYKAKNESPGSLHSVARQTGLLLGDNGVIRSWGDQWYGGIEYTTEDKINTVEGRYRDLATAYDAAWAVNTDGNIAIWGYGPGTLGFYDRPHVFEGQHDFTQVVLDGRGATALDSDGVVRRLEFADITDEADMSTAWTRVNVAGGAVLSQLQIDYEDRLWALDEAGSIWFAPFSAEGFSLQKVAGTSGYSDLHGSRVDAITVKKDGSLHYWEGDPESDGDMFEVTTPNVEGRSVDYWNFVASDGDWYVRQMGDSWVNRGVPSTTVTTPEETPYYCSSAT